MVDYLVLVQRHRGAAGPRGQSSPTGALRRRVRYVRVFPVPSSQFPVSQSPLPFAHTRSIKSTHVVMQSPRMSSLQAPTCPRRRERPQCARATRTCNTPTRAAGAPAQRGAPWPYPSRKTRARRLHSANRAGSSRMLSGNGSTNPLMNCDQNPTHPSANTTTLKKRPFSSTAEACRYPCRTAYVSTPRANSCDPRAELCSALMVTCSSHATATPANLHPYLTDGATHFRYSSGVSSCSTGSRCEEATLCAMPPTVTPMVTHAANLTRRVATTAMSPA
mmetsp:Transcript_5811/g.14415  ORF Transcript_5811/g.14415 Transcript_5811/m.14415 type:complete len:277 (-) Transcript_5811:699-1529(-)